MQKHVPRNSWLNLALVLVLEGGANIASKQDLRNEDEQAQFSQRVYDVRFVLELLAESGYHGSNDHIEHPKPLKALLGFILAVNPRAGFTAPLHDLCSVREATHTNLGPGTQTLPARTQRSMVHIAPLAQSRSIPLCMTALPSLDVASIKSNILQIAALTDRGQRLNKLIAPTYQEKRDQLSLFVQQLVDHSLDLGMKPTQALLSGEWELVYSDVELFRSSPFFLAIEEALNSSPGPEWAADFERFLGGDGYGGDKDKRAELFFKLHQLQVLSWGVSTVGRIAQRLDFESGVLESSFDSTLFGLTVIPIFGWFKLLPTFGGRIVTEADGLTLTENGTLCMELQRTKAVPVEGIPKMPLIWDLVKDRWFPVNGFWKLLPWNGGPFEGRAPTCSMKVEYVDENMRISRDGAGGLFVYTRPL